MLGVAGGVGCGVGLTTTQRGNDGPSSCGGVAGSCTVGNVVATTGRGWAMRGTVGDLAAFSPVTSTLHGRMSKIILPTQTEVCDLRRSMGALAVLSRRPAVMTVVAECCACHECAAAISVDGVREGWGRGTNHMV